MALIGMVVLATAYVFFRFFVGSRKPVDVYEQQLEQVLNSEEYKVKGRFD